MSMKQFSALLLALLLAPVAAFGQIGPSSGYTGATDGLTTITGGYLLSFSGATVSAGANGPIITITGGGTGCTLGAGALGQLVTSNGATGCTLAANGSISAGVLSLGASGTLGAVKMGNATTGTLQLQPAAGALGTITVSIPAASDTLVNLGSVQTLTNKTLASPAFTGTVTGNGTIPNAVLVNSSLTLAGHLVSLGGTQAIACGDLSNDGTACTANTGTSGATVPFLNGANTWSGVQTYTNSDFKLLGSSTGATTFTSANAGASNFTITVPAATDTIAELGQTQTFSGINTFSNHLLFSGLGTGTQVSCLGLDSGNNVIPAAGACGSGGGGSGTVTSVGAGCGTSTGGSPITTSGNVTAALNNRVNTLASDPIVSTDCGNMVQENRATAVAVSIAQAGTAGFAAGFYTDVCNINAGAATITPTTSTIGGAATYVVAAGTAAAPTCVGIQSDGTNYNVLTSGGSGGVSSVSNSDGTLTISPTTGAVVASINLGHANAWTGAQTFGQVQGGTNVQSGATYTMAATDCGKTIVSTNAGAVTMTIPASIVPASGTACVINVLATQAAKVSVNGTAVSAATLISGHSYTGTSGSAGAMISLTLTTISAATDAFLTGDGS